VEQLKGVLGVLLAVPGVGLMSYGVLTHVASHVNFAPPSTATLSPTPGAKGATLRFKF
jgi:hypothetical protein